MDGSSFGPQRAAEFGFAPAPHHPDAYRNPGPRDGGDPAPEMEWGLSAVQVVAVVLAILAACGLIGMLG